MNDEKAHERNQSSGEGNRPIDRNMFFSHRACDYFPCHDGVDLDRFNCLFCYCPLYALGDRCGGAFTYTESGVKNCSACALPHEGDDGARMVRERFDEISSLAKRRDSFSWHGKGREAEDGKGSGERPLFSDASPADGVAGGRSSHDRASRGEESR